MTRTRSSWSSAVRRIVVPFAVIVATGVLAPTALATFPGSNGLLVTTIYEPTYGGALVTMQPDGSDPTVIPTGSVPNVRGAKWSPDGQRLAFISFSFTTEFPYSAWIVDADGTGLRMVADNIGAGGVAWSPDGLRLAVSGPRDPGYGTTSVEEVTVATGDRRIIVPAVVEEVGPGPFNTVGQTAWSPDGTTLAVTAEVAGQGYAQLFAVNVATGAVQQLTFGALVPDTYPGGYGQADWSPTGEAILFRCPLSKYQGDICRIRPDGTGVEILTESPPYALGDIFDDPDDFRTAIYAPDGTRIAVTRNGTFETRNLAGGDPVSIPAGIGDGLDWQAIPGSPSPDTDGDGVANGIDTGVGTFSDAGTPPTTGAIVDAGGLAVLVTDAAAPDGVTVTTGPGPAGARSRLQVCGFTLLLSPGSTATLTCGSISVRTTAGRVEVVSANGSQTTPVPSGSAAKFTGTSSGGYTVQQTAGASLRVFVGFDAPVDNGGVFNEVKAGRAIPLKWRVVTAGGAAVTTIAAATVTASAVPCTAGAAVDALEESLPDGSALKNVGNGNYSINWKSPTSYAGTCKLVKVDMGGGLAPTALFRFTR